MRLRRHVGLALSVLLASAAALAQEVAIPPPPARWVTDDAGFLSPAVRGALDARLESYERATGHQVLVWIGHSTGSVPLEAWCVRAFQSWRVGRRGIDDGLVLFLFADDRKVHIEVGYGLEPAATDAQTSRIIRDVITPRLRAGDRDGAVGAGVDALLALAGGGGAPARHVVLPRVVTLAKLIVGGIAALAFLILLLVRPQLALFLLAAMFSGGRRGGGGGGGGGGWSGGGGGSGGGGSSGSW